jgi:hypothetical protein
MTRIAISSVGSLVGQNILDSLQGRREGIEVIGINSTAAAASNFRCDRAYLVPPASRSDEYLDRLTAILRDEKPDLVLPGRDDDVLALARLKQAQPGLSASLPVGPYRLARVLDDKWASHEYARQHDLPYVDSALCDDPVAVERLLARHGFPLIAKPRDGNGSRGVRIVFDQTQLAAAIRSPGGLMQPYLEPEAGVMSWRDLAADGVPLFHAPVLQQIACQSVIGPDGRIRGLVSTIAEMVMGRSERTYRIDDPAVDAIVRRYAENFASEGWVGILNLQGRRDREGKFRVYELNGRFTGTTAARLHLGFDEVGMLIEAFTRQQLPAHTSVGRDGIVTKSLTEFAIAARDVAALEADGRWQRGSGRAALH